MKDSTPSKWDILEDELHADCRVFDIRRHKCKHPVDKREGDFFVIDSVDWVNVIAKTTEGEIILVHQYRFGIQDLSWEVPGGLLDPGEDPIVAGQRELLEETGYKGENPRIIGVCYPNPAILSNRCHFLYVENCSFVQEPSWDANEEIDVQTVTVDKVEQWLKEGKPFHSLTVNALMYLKLL